jgi:hypothetical protein
VNQPLPKPRSMSESDAKPIPRATYRLQFHKEFGFRDAAALAPYLARLGISHVYASPHLKGRPGRRKRTGATSTEEIAEASEPLTPPVGVSELSADTEAALELAFWDSVKDGTPAELESYLGRYPESTFAPLAKAKLEAAAQSSETRTEAAAAVRELSADSEAALELAFWENVKDGSSAELETYLDKYPEGTFASLAKTSAPGWRLS